MLEPLHETLLQSLDPLRSRISPSIQNILNQGGVSIDSNVTDRTPSSGIENLSEDELLMRLNQDASITDSPATPVQRYLDDSTVYDTRADDFIARMVREAFHYNKLSNEELRREMESLNIKPEIVDRILVERANRSAPNPTPMQFQQ